MQAPASRRALQIPWGLFYRAENDEWQGPRRHCNARRFHAMESYPAACGDEMSLVARAMGVRTPEEQLRANSSEVAFMLGLDVLSHSISHNEPPW
jgi:hypothetical protein